jgi:flagellar motor switch protein FliM
LLGGAEREEGSRKDLSLLEESLLSDIGSAIVQALCQSHPNCSFRPDNNVVRRLMPLELKGTEELCKVAFSVQKTDSQENTEAHLLVLCERLEPIIGKAAQDVAVFSAEDISKAILGRLQQVLVPVTARLASVALTLEEIMDLKVGDVLLLDKEVGEPVELIIGDRPTFRGQPGKSAGKYAVVITDVAPDTA